MHPMKTTTRQTPTLTAPSAPAERAPAYSLTPISSAPLAKLAGMPGRLLTSGDGHCTLAFVYGRSPELAALFVRAVNAHAGLVAALRAISQRVAGEFDAPELAAFGALLPDTAADCQRIALAALPTAAPSPATVAAGLVIDGTDESGDWAGDEGDTVAPFCLFSPDSQEIVAGPFDTREEAAAARRAIRKDPTCAARFLTFPA